MNYRNQKGFTLIEVIVVAGIIAILAGILVPMIFNQIDESKNARAKADCDTIAKAILLFKTNTGKWPMFSAGTAAPCTADNATPIVLLTSEGNLPVLDTTKGWTSTGNTRFNQLLGNNNPSIASDGANKCYPLPDLPGGVGWKGPYLSSAETDPWGNAYVINVADLETTKRVYVLSAGPDGILQTSTDDSLGGDDIGVQIK